MTSETLSNHSPNNNTQGYNSFINIKLLINNIRQHKVLIIITGILLFFARPLVQIISIMSYYNAWYNDEPIESFAKGNAQVSTFLVPLVTLILAVAIGLVTSSYMHNRKSAIFYNSIPIKRISLFATQYLSGLAYFIPALAASYIISSILMPYEKAFIINTQYYLASLCFFLLIYSFVILCANISGTFLNSFLTITYLCSIVPAIVYTFLAFAEIFYRFTSLYGITDNSFFEIIFYPVVIYFPHVFMAHYIEYFSFLDGSLMIIFAAGLTCLAYLFNRMTKTENAEKPFYFEKFLGIFKYSVLIILVLLSGMIFYAASGYSFPFLFIGIAVGGILAFMMVNLVIYKNIREVFKGLRKFGILALCVALSSGLLSADILNIDKYIPDASKVNAVSFYHYGSLFSHYSDYSYDYDYYYRDEYRYYGGNFIYINDTDTIQLINDVFAAALKSTTSRTEYESNFSWENHPLSYNNMTNYKLKNGFSFTKKISYYDLYFKNADDLADYDNTLIKLRSSPGYKQAYYYPLTDSNEMQKQISRADDISIFFGEERKIITQAQLEILLQIINDDIRTSSMSKSVIQHDLSIQIQNYTHYDNYDNYNSRFYIGLTDEFEQTINYLWEMFYN